MKRWRALTGRHEHIWHTSISPQHHAQLEAREISHGLVMLDRWIDAN